LTKINVRLRRKIGFRFVKIRDLPCLARDFRIGIAREKSSFAPLGLVLSLGSPTACAVGCILSPLRGWLKRVPPGNFLKVDSRRG